MTDIPGINDLPPWFADLRRKDAEIVRLRAEVERQSGALESAFTTIGRLQALLREVRGDIYDYGFSDSFADETHKTLAKIDAELGTSEQEVQTKRLKVTTHDRGRGPIDGQS